ncbi:hypothetical protein ABE073_04075 [Lederbergia citrisecunda]|uniref:hypothetical protein n=1 Tax=Lederbergia citrisecunda TaxID=2833583 RepID=UPI003D28943B
MSNDNRKCKTVSFDLTDEVEVRLLGNAESKGNFSRYMKRLIEKDLNGWERSESKFDGLDFVLTDDICEVEGVPEKEENGNELNGFI